MYIASRGLKKKKVPTVIVPKCIKATVEKLLAVQRELDESPLPVNLIGMDVSVPDFDAHESERCLSYKVLRLRRIDIRA